MRISDNLKEFIKVIEHFGSQKELADKLNLSQQFIWNVRHQKCPMSPLVALKIQLMTKGKFKAIDLLTKKQQEFLEAN